MTDRPRVTLVTGATDGIGKETARLLVARGHDVIVHGRTRAKAEAAARDVGAARSVAADLASLDEVDAMAREVVAWGALDVLVNNAGVYMKARRLTRDGREMTMAVNHDAPFLLTHLLLPLLEARGGRVINVSSIAHLRGRIDLDDLDFARGFDGYAAYAASKLANVLFTVELARRLAARADGGRVSVNALHPGVVGTKLLRAGFNMSGPDSHEDGAATSVHLATSDVGGAVSGRYFVRSEEATPSSAARDEALCRAFFEASLARVGLPG